MMGLGALGAALGSVQVGVRFQETTTPTIPIPMLRESAQTHHQCASDVQQCVCHFHL